MAASPVAAHARTVSESLPPRSTRECPFHPAGHGAVSQEGRNHQDLFAPYLAALSRAPSYAGVTSKTPATTCHTHFETRHNSRRYLRAISPSAEEAMCSARHHEA